MLADHETEDPQVTLDEVISNPLDTGWDVRTKGTVASMDSHRQSFFFNPSPLPQSPEKILRTWGKLVNSYKNGASQTITPDVEGDWFLTICLRRTVDPDTVGRTGMIQTLPFPTVLIPSSSSPYFLKIEAPGILGPSVLIH